MIRDFDEFRERLKILKDRSSVLGFDIPRGNRLPMMFKELADCISELSNHIEDLEKQND